MVIHTCKSSLWEAEAKGSWVQGHPQLDKKFKVSLNYMKVCLNIPKKWREVGVRREMNKRKKKKKTVKEQQELRELCERKADNWAPELGNKRDHSTLNTFIS